jgi:very-short-patch-repair endonuclease
MSAQSHSDRVISRIASRQHGVVARRQLLAAGITRNQIGHRLARWRLHELHRGVYLVGHSVPPAYAREMAALLACGPTAVISHRSAAAVWRLLPYPPPGDVCVTVPPGRSAARADLEIHRVVIARPDIRHRHRLALTSPPRTILDLAASYDERSLEALVAEANYRRLASEDELRAQLDRNPLRRGRLKLRDIHDRPGGPQRTRSPAERELLRVLRRAGITGFECNARIHGYQVDFLWRELSFVVEVDGWDAHSGRVAFERDRLKVATLNAKGITVMPVTGRQIRDDPDGVLGRVVAALA